MCEEFCTQEMMDKHPSFDSLQKPKTFSGLCLWYPFIALVFIFAFLTHPKEVATDVIKGNLRQR